MVLRPPEKVAVRNGGEGIASGRSRGAVRLWGLRWVGGWGKRSREYFKSRFGWVVTNCC